MFLKGDIVKGNGTVVGIEIKVEVTQSQTTEELAIGKFTGRLIEVGEGEAWRVDALNKHLNIVRDSWAASKFKVLSERDAFFRSKKMIGKIAFRKGDETVVGIITGAVIKEMHVTILKSTDKFFKVTRNYHQLVEDWELPEEEVTLKFNNNA